jgi:YesN/AraC family two-component response regulator
LEVYKILYKLAQYIDKLVNFQDGLTLSFVGKMFSVKQIINYFIAEKERLGNARSTMKANTKCFSIRWCCIQIILLNLFISLNLTLIKLVVNTHQKLVWICKKKVNRLMNTAKQAQSGNPNNIKDIPVLNSYIMFLEMIKHDHVHLNPDLSRTSLAKTMGIHENTLTQIIKKNTGLSFTEFINKERVHHAMQLICAPDSSCIGLEHIGLQSGFHSRRNFYRIFKQETGFTPNNYRTLCKGNAEKFSLIFDS